MRKKFDIYYPANHPDETKAGKKYKPKKGMVVVMTTDGVFLIVGSDGWYCSVRKLSDEIGKYNVVWRNE